MDIPMGTPMDVLDHPERNIPSIPLAGEVSPLIQPVKYSRKPKVAANAGANL